MPSRKTRAQLRLSRNQRRLVNWLKRLARDIDGGRAHVTDTETEYERMAITETAFPFESDDVVVAQKTTLRIVAGKEPKWTKP